MSTPPLPFLDSGSSSLVRVNGARPASKREQAVNKLLKKVERLRADLERETRRLDAALVAFAAEVEPRRTCVLARRADLARALRPFLHDRRLKKRETQVVRQIVCAQVDAVIANDPEPPADIRELFEQLRGIAYEDVVEDQLEDVRASFEAMFGALGLDVEVPHLRPDMTDEDVAAAMAGLEERVRAQEEAAATRSAARPRTKRELREEERTRKFDEVRKISLGASYRRLVKALHPDLEQDSQQRERKSVVMQEVTAAYARNDLHALLRLELEWLDGMQAGSTALADDTLDAYAQFLKQQAAELQDAIQLLPFSPRYAPLLEEGSLFGLPVCIDVPQEVARLDAQIAGLTEIHRRFTTSDSLAHVREMIEAHEPAAHRPRNRRARRRRERR